ncbi:carbohydrate kinase family protein [Nonomuraea deserti]|uniref:Carbohydrate kinase family protein n=1 Tax=Nonomuraea deserti TaxID=1848322 RepID=A0A4R4UYH1_9ACTN|nr:carbohydrate kinase family protein [Nonomuraea deserti]TDC97778.1 carbohydrate kinase family protein [Nonomuraea deserti]
MADIDLLVLGELNADVIVECGATRPTFGQVEDIVDDAEIVLGSSGAITACGAARLGARVAFAGVVGDDWLGDFVLERLGERGVDTTHCLRRRGRRTGMSIVLSSDGDRSILTFPGEIGRLAAGDVAPEALAAARHVHVSSYFLQYDLWEGLPGLFRAARDRGVTTSVDPNWDPGRTFDHGLPALLPLVDYLLPNEAEAVRIAAALTAESGEDRDAGRAAAALAGAGTTAVVKRGADGALLHSPGGTVWSVSAPAVTPVETTGAGDSFDAGLLAALLAGQDLPAALRLASACGALSTQGRGGTAAQPERGQAAALARNLTVTEYEAPVAAQADDGREQQQ